MRILLLTLIAVIGFSTTSISQGVNQVTISPSNPGATDTISVISNFSYYGNCSFSIVQIDTFLIGSTIYIAPTYCGYGDSTLCHHVDTFKIGPYPMGNYMIRIDYHQGSVCPFSGFDATIAQFDTTITISGSTSSGLTPDINTSIHIFPNPFSSSTTLQTDVVLYNASIRILNMLGQSVKEINNISGQYVTLDLEDLTNGLYFIQLVQDHKTLSFEKFVISY